MIFDTLILIKYDVSANLKAYFELEVPTPTP